MAVSSNIIIKVSALIIIFVVFTLLLTDKVSGGGIGGGSYDLSGLVYGSLFFVFIFIWMLWISIAYFSNKNSANRKAHIILLFTGMSALIAAWFITPSMF